MKRERFNQVVIILNLHFLVGLNSQTIIDLSGSEENIRFIGANSNDEFGYYVASGDVNGDGFSDAIIGASATNPEERNLAGMVYVIFGSAEPDNLFDASSDDADMIIYGAKNNDHLGKVASGDINNDGYDDIIAGAYVADPEGRNSAGEVYIIYGRDDGYNEYPSIINLAENEEDVRILGANVKDCLGMSLATGDINGDGTDDVIMGAYSASQGGYINVGQVHVIYGETNLNPIINLHEIPSDVTVLGDDERDIAGAHITSGDMNNDQYDEIIIGAQYADPKNRDRAGEVYVIFGCSALADTIDLSSQEEDIRILGEAPGYCTGLALACKDINKDNFDDLFAGAPMNYASGPGYTYIIYGSSDLEEITEIDLAGDFNGITIKGKKAGDNCGYTLTSGDMNKDNINDICVGAYLADPDGRSNAGETYVIFGSKQNPSIIDLSLINPDIEIHGDDSGDWLSHAALSTGDFNNDKVDDIFVGAVFAEPQGKTNTGEAYIIYGVKNNKPPIANAGPDSVCDATSCEGALVTLSGCKSSDPDEDTLTYSWYEEDKIIAGPTEVCESEVPLPLGEHFITLVVDDGNGETNSDVVVITVQDTTKPNLSISLSTNQLWPPDHKMVDITVDVEVSDLCTDWVDFVLDTIISNEPDDAKGMGDGNTVDDIQDADYGTSDTEFSLRVERDGKGEGRFYEVVYIAKDGSDNITTVSDTVWIMQSQKKLKKNQTQIAAIPDKFTLHQNHPNPFNPATEIQFSLPESRQVTLTIYNNFGQEVHQLTNQHFQAGHHTITWEGTDTHGTPVSSGIYIYQIRAGEFIDVKKMMLMR
ncbi:FG-GAP repeat protein [bacterium]|nr:FG-GAP repeat protein [bacterium]